MGLFETLKSFLLRVWDSLKKIWTRIVNFFNHIANWFRAKYREVIYRRPNALPIVMKIEEGLKTGNYSTADIGLKKSVTNEKSVVKTFYDRSTGEILVDNTEVVEYVDLDAETKNRFGNKDMLILE